MKSIQINLRAGERIFINGAVMRVDRKVRIEFLNDVTFLLESHVMTSENATTPLKQLYFIVQTMLIDPNSTEELREMYARSSGRLRASLENKALLAGLTFVDDLVVAGKSFAALKELRGFFAIEEEILRPAAARMAPAAFVHEEARVAACK